MEKSGWKRKINNEENFNLGELEGGRGGYAYICLQVTTVKIKS